MARLLSQTQQDWMRNPFEWGETDCGLSVLEYVCRVLKRRPATYPSHTDEASAGELLRESGGLLTYASGIMSSLGLEETSSPVAGDVGIVDLPVVGYTCAIRTGDRWMMRGERRILLASPPLVRAWRVE